ncbi:hypothetical protein CWI36_1936p0010, partial [Hamiltosporidium magnivora]
MDAKIGKDYVCSSIRNYTLHKEHYEKGFRLLYFAIRGNLIFGNKQIFDELEDTGSHEDTVPSYEEVHKANHKGNSDCSGLEGVINRNRLEGVSDTIDDYKGVITYTNTLHPVNTNTTTFTIWNSFVFGDCKLSEIFKYFKRVWNVDISMVTIRDTVVFCTFYDYKRFKNYLEKFI